MPNIRSASKAMRSSARKRMRNKSVKSALKTFTSRAEKLVSRNLTEEAVPAVVKAASALDRAAQKDVIHPNKAARLKSRLAKKLNKAVAAVEAGGTAPAQAEAAKPKKRAGKGGKPKA